MRVVGAICFLVATATISERAIAEPAPVQCKTVDDCWLNESGEAIKRPKRHRGKAIPRGNCGNRLHWLRHLLSCEENVCKAKLIGDKC